jgi:UDP-MurNAc hydroxylase
MRISFLASATVLIETRGLKILTDPWLCDGAFYGSWCHYPPVDIDRIDFGEIDYVYLSHVHPDHLDPATFARIPKSVPVLIHRFDKLFLKRNVERLGFAAVEIPHGEPFHLGHGVTIHIYGADNCDPEICGHMFGCVPKAPRGSLQIDSLCVINDGAFTLVNTNDCPYEIAYGALGKIKADFGEIDIALVGYSSASLFPHCMTAYDAEAMERGKQVAQKRGLVTGLRTLQTLRPRYYMPFAGTYVLGGAVSHKTRDMPIIELPDVVAYFERDPVVVNSQLSPILLNSGESFDLSLGAVSREYQPIDPTARLEYVNTVLSKRRFPYEEDPLPSLDLFSAVLEDCFKRFSQKRQEIGVVDDHVIYLSVSPGNIIRLPMDGSLCRMDAAVDENAAPYSVFELDPRLLLRAMKGPAFANWNNIEIGAHLGFRRNPDVYNPQMHILLNYFHQ